MKKNDQGNNILLIYKFSSYSIRCNRLVLHLKLPDSMIHLGGVKTAIMSAYTGNTCGKECTTKPPVTRRTQRTTKRASITTKLLNTTTKA